MLDKPKTELRATREYKTAVAFLLYAGLVLMTVGVGILFGWGWGLLLFGLFLAALGVLGLGRLK